MQGSSRNKAILLVLILKSQGYLIGYLELGFGGQECPNICWNCILRFFPHETLSPSGFRPQVLLVASIRDLVVFGIRSISYRNSYRYRIYHIYEIVKLNQIKLSNQFNYSESEKRFKAFIEHDLA